jgi:hypothetical protein
MAAPDAFGAAEVERSCRCEEEAQPATTRSNNALAAIINGRFTARPLAKEVLIFKIPFPV